MSIDLTEERIRQIIGEEMKEYSVRKRTPVAPSTHEDDHYGDHHGSAWGPHDWGHGAPHNSWAPIIMLIPIQVG